MYPKCYHKYQISVYQVRNNANFLKKIKYFSEIFYFYRIKYTDEKKCIGHIILLVVFRRLDQTARINLFLQGQ